MGKMALGRILASAVGITPLFGFPCLARQDTAIKPHEFVTSEMRRQHIPGLSLAILRDGRIVLIKGYGLANLA